MYASSDKQKRENTSWWFPNKSEHADQRYVLETAYTIMNNALSHLVVAVMLNLHSIASCQVTAFTNTIRVQQHVFNSEVQQDSTGVHLECNRGSNSKQHDN